MSARQPRPAVVRPGALALGLALGLAFALPTPSRAQQSLVLEPEPTPRHELACDGTLAPPPRSADATTNAEAERLTNAATQAMLLGDLDGAVNFLDRALRADSNAVEAVYLRARVLNQAGRSQEAVGAFCRLLALDPAGTSAAEARERLEEARSADPAIGALYDAFANGVGFYRDARLPDAVAAFSRVLDARPAAASALYNRAIVRAAAGELLLARDDLARYRELVRLRPHPATVADSATVDGLLAWLDAETRGPSPGAALGLGVLLPGAGQFYTSRPLLGSVVLLASGGAVAAGFLIERVHVECRQAAPSGECPDDQIASSETERPWLVPAIGVAAGLWLVGAIEASLHARAARRPPASARSARRSSVRVELRVLAAAAELRVVVPSF